MTETWSDLLMADHEQTEKVIDALEKAWSRSAPDPRQVAKAMRYFGEFADACHNRKEEEHLFPRLSAAGMSSDGGPLGVMLMEHEESERLLGAFLEAGGRYVAGDASVAGELVQVFLEYSALLKNHYWKENDILYPMGRQMLSDQDAAAVVDGILGVERELGPDTRRKYQVLAGELTQGTLEDLSTGLDRNLLAAILNTLPVELSFVDADDRVRYFSHENHAKIFPRTRGAIGMNVRNCHPQKSLHMVERIIEDFRAGKRDVAEFWIDMGPRKIHIRYYPVRGDEGEYLGCLETVQDVTGIRALEGQKRLLDE